VRVFQRIKRGEVSTALVTVADDWIVVRLGSRVGTTVASIPGFPAGTHGRLHRYFFFNWETGDWFFEWGHGSLQLTVCR